MVDKGKMTTVSVRVEEDLMQQVERVANIMAMNKSDFLRGCLDKLVRDNRMLLDHCHRVSEYITFIRNELKTLPPDMVRVKDGSWDDVQDALIFMLCNNLWLSSEIVFNKWKDLLAKYNLSREVGGVKIKGFSDAQESEGLLDLQKCVFVLAEQSGQLTQEDIDVLLNEKHWINDVEADIVSLSYAVRSALEDHPIHLLFKKFIESAEEEEEGDAPLRVVIDSKGRFRRSGYVLRLPIYFEKIDSLENK